MNNIFDINKLLNTDDIKAKYKYIQKFLTLKDKLSKESIITIINIDYNLKSVLHHVNNLEYLIFTQLRPNGGIGEYMNILKDISYTEDSHQNILYTKLFDMVIVDKDINNPLCNCCLTEYNPQYDSQWYTSSCTHKEIYNSGKQYISYNYIHICNKCNECLKVKIKKYYDTLKLIPFSKDIFNKQSIAFIKYQTLIFNLLFNYDIEGIKEVMKNTRINRLDQEQ